MPARFAQHWVKQMAWTTGTATNAADFYSKLITFLTTDTDLVTAGENWSVVWTGSGSYANDKVICGPGLSGDDEIYIGMRLESDAANDRFSILVCGLTGYEASAVRFNEHVNPSTPVRMFLDSNSTTYWFVASGRRFVAINKITTVYEAVYAGLYLPYAFPTTYPYPMFVGGSSGSGVYFSNTWRSTLDYHRHFTNPVAYTPDGYLSQAFFIDPLGNWAPVVNNGTRSTNSPYMAPIRAGTGLFANPTGHDYGYGYATMTERMQACFDGSMALTPMTLVTQGDADVTFGILDGVYMVPGVGNGAENIITVDSVDHLVVQNVFRTSTNDYWALKLE